MNINCIICSDLFAPSDDVFVTPCGHLFHHACLMQWLERSKSCPQCRNRTTEKSIIKVYFNVANTDGMENDICSLHSKLDNVKFKLKSKEKEISNQQEVLTEYKDRNKKAVEMLKNLEDKIKKLETAALAYRDQINHLKVQTTIMSDFQVKNKTLQEQIIKLKNIDDILKSSANDVDNFMVNQQDPDQLATYVSVIKRELVSSENKRKDISKQMKNLQMDLIAVKSERNKLRQNSEENTQLEDELKRLEFDKNELLNYIKELQAKSVMGSVSLPVANKRERSTEKELASPTVADRVRHIQESNSPYLDVQSSSVGITPLRTLQSTSTGRKNVGKPTEKYSIFKKPRLGKTSAPNKYIFDNMEEQCKLVKSSSLDIRSRSHILPASSSMISSIVRLPKISSHKMKGLSRPKSMSVQSENK